jgi:hypothetical protein
LLGVAVLAVGWPLWRERQEPEIVEEALVASAAVADPLGDLIDRRDSIYQAIKELEFDYQVGKVSEVDYQAFDAQLKTQAVAVLKEMDALQAAEVDAALDAQIEAEIAALRRNGHARANLEPSPAVAFCPQCGRQARSGDRFCGSCGAALT